MGETKTKEESPLIIMRAKCIKFIEGTFKRKWKGHMAMDMVDVLLTQYFFPYNEEAKQQAKKEVFDDIESICIIPNDNLRRIDLRDLSVIKHLKQRHLSTFPKEKQHNYRKKKSASNIPHGYYPCKKCKDFVPIRFKETHKCEAD